MHISKKLKHLENKELEGGLPLIPFGGTELICIMNYNISTKRNEENSTFIHHL